MESKGYDSNLFVIEVTRGGRQEFQVPDSHAKVVNNEYVNCHALFLAKQICCSCACFVITASTPNCHDMTIFYSCMSSFKCYSMKHPDVISRS